MKISLDYYRPNFKTLESGPQNPAQEIDENCYTKCRQKHHRLIVLGQNYAKTGVQTTGLGLP